MATTIVHDGNGLFENTGLTASESTDQIGSTNGGMLTGCVHVTNGGGTNFNSGTVTVQASLDGNNWFTAKDVGYNDMTLTAEGYYEFCLSAQFIRVTADGSIGDVDVSFFIA